jgi:hypothetical protein
MMASGREARDVLPRPRIPNVFGILNVIFAAFLMLFSLYMAWYAAIMPMSNRAMTEVREKAEADLEAKRQIDLKALDEAEKRATTAVEKAALAAQRKALEVRPTLAIPIGMDLKGLGLGDRFDQFTKVDATTAIAVDIAMLVAGIGLLRRTLWGIRLAIAVAAVKIIRLVLLYTYLALVLIPPIAQGSGRLAFEVVVQQQKAMGAAAPPALNAAFFVRMYFIMYTVMAVSMMLFGVIYPAISLWFLSRPGARAACEPRARQDRELSEPRVLGITNVVFATCLILFGLCLGTYVAAMPVLGRTLTQIQKKSEADSAARQKAALEAIAEEEKKAATASEKEALAEQRKVVESRPKPNLGFTGMDLGQMGFDHPRVQAYYWIDLTSGLILNIAMITAGIGLLRQKSWGINLGMATAAAKIIRLAVVYTFFVLAVAPVLAEKSAAMVGRMIVQQQAVVGQALPGELDTSPLRQAYASMYPPIAVAFMVAGSIYPAVSIWVLLRARARAGADKKVAPVPALGEDLP